MPESTACERRLAESSTTSTWTDKELPWSYRLVQQREDLWGLNIHTTGEERDCIIAAVTDYQSSHPAERDAAFEAAKAQVIPLQANATCLRCGKATVTVEGAKRTTCSACGASYALSPLTG